MAGFPLGASHNAGMYRSPYASARHFDISAVRPADLAEALSLRVSAPTPVGYPNKWKVHNIATAKCVICDNKLATGVVCDTCHETKFCLDCFQKGSSKDGLWQNLEGCWCQYGEQSLNPQVFDPDASQHYESLRALTAAHYQDHPESMSSQGRPHASLSAHAVALTSMRGSTTANPPAAVTTEVRPLLLSPGTQPATAPAPYLHVAMPATSCPFSKSQLATFVASGLASRQDQAQQSDMTQDVQPGSFALVSMQQGSPVYAESQDGLAHSTMRAVETSTAAPADLASAVSPPTDQPTSS